MSSVASLPATLLALDFDGVLHPVFPRADRTDAENRHWSCLPALEAVLRDFPDVGVLVTSSWRTQREWSWLVDRFSPDIRPRLLGATPVLAANGQGSRHDEVEAWLAAKGRTGEAWVGLDDVPDLYRPGAAVVAVDDGFTASDAEALKEALRAPALWAERHPVVWDSDLVLPKPRVRASPSSVP